MTHTTITRFKLRHKNTAVCTVKYTRSHRLGHVSNWLREVAYLALNVSLVCSDYITPRDVTQTDVLFKTYFTELWEVDAPDWLRWFDCLFSLYFSSSADTNLTAVSSVSGLSMGFAVCYKHKQCVFLHHKSSLTDLFYTYRVPAKEWQARYCVDILWKSKPRSIHCVSANIKSLYKLYM